MQVTTIQLADYLNDPVAFGSKIGNEVRQRIARQIEKQYRQKHYQISLKGIQAFDACFARDAIVTLVKQFKTKKGFVLVDLPDDRISLNLSSASRVKEQPLLAKIGDDFHVVGCNDTTVKSVLDQARKRKIITSRDVAQQLGVSLQLASSKLKCLYEAGCLLRDKRSAESGGVEYHYSSILF